MYISHEHNTRQPQQVSRIVVVMQSLALVAGANLIHALLRSIGTCCGCGALRSPCMHPLCNCPQQQTLITHILVIRFASRTLALAAAWAARPGSMSRVHAQNTYGSTRRLTYHYHQPHCARRATPRQPIGGDFIISLPLRNPLLHLPRLLFLITPIISSCNDPEACLGLSCMMGYAIDKNRIAHAVNNSTHSLMYGMGYSTCMELAQIALKWFSKFCRCFVL